jgi:putative SOS response-associated peptidase YedK
VCGRYLTPDQAAFERHFGLAVPPDYFRSYNLAPSQSGPVVRISRAGDRVAELFTWGFQPAWAKRAWINARSETAFTSTAFGSAARKRRCLVPTLGWYEWQGQKAPKQPFVFHLDGFRPFAFAGLWTARQTEDGWQGSYAILTTAARPPLDEIHNRMPVVLAPEDYDSWISPDTASADAEAIAARSFGEVQTYPVSTYVNKPANDDAACIKPTATGRLL